METIRSFIAVQLPPEVRKTLSQLQHALMPGPGIPVKWVEIKNLHLTLKFLGNIDSASAASIMAVMKEATVETGNLHLETSGPGTFPGGRRVRVIWVGLSGDIDKLSAVQERIETGLVPLGFPKEQRTFQPHLTIGRVRDQASSAEREELYRRVQQHSTIDKVRFSISSVFLMKSTLMRSGPVYTELGKVSF